MLRFIGELLFLNRHRNLALAQCSFMARDYVTNTDWSNILLSISIFYCALVFLNPKTDDQ
jgi:hypothetical protein